jgi:hypothetical protein
MVKALSAIASDDPFNRPGHRHESRPRIGPGRRSRPSATRPRSSTSLSNLQDHLATGRPLPPVFSTADKSNRRRIRSFNRTAPPACRMIPVALGCGRRCGAIEAFSSTNPARNRSVRCCRPVPPGPDGHNEGVPLPRARQPANRHDRNTSVTRTRSDKESGPARSLQRPQTRPGPACPLAHSPGCKYPRRRQSRAGGAFCTHCRCDERLARQRPMPQPFQPVRHPRENTGVRNAPILSAGGTTSL